MYIHIGDNKSLRIMEIIGIFDLEVTTTTAYTRDLLKKAEREGKCQSLSQEMPKTFILAGKDDDINIYLTPLSTETIRRRIKSMRRF